MSNDVRISILAAGIGEHICSLNPDQFSALQSVLTITGVKEGNGVVTLKAVEANGTAHHWDLGSLFPEIVAALKVL